MKWEGVIAGLTVAGLNGALALATVRWALDKGMQVFLTAFIGGMALRMMLVGDSERLDAERAYQVGLVSQVVPLAELMPTALKIAEAVSKHDIYAQMGTVESLWKGQELGMLQGIRQGLLIRQLQNYKSRLAQSG